jgi:hypothetical protein
MDGSFQVYKNLVVDAWQFQSVPKREASVSLFLYLWIKVDY